MDKKIMVNSSELWSQLYDLGTMARDSIKELFKLNHDTQIDLRDVFDIIKEDEFFTICSIGENLNEKQIICKIKIVNGQILFQTKEQLDLNPSTKKYYDVTNTNHFNFTSIMLYESVEYYYKYKNA